ncbi:MAG: Rrf2 family transcriptional regulator [Tissierellia bacterium]|nr:Rrf2 family transcriptional regulator [Tissierellia bacterium]
MRLTIQTDYAFRLVLYLSTFPGKVISAPILADKLCITERFTLRILRKLNLAGITTALRGPYGGYKINRDPKDITMYDVVKAINGDIEINCCTQADPYCSRNAIACCAVNVALTEIQSMIIEEFKSRTFDYLVKEGCRPV